MRPGERLREELLSANESFASAEIGGVACVAHRARDAQLDMNIPSFQDQLDLPPDALTGLAMDLARRLQ
jgi:FlaA1/EpsC-like NDP-sugar epimerase